MINAPLLVIAPPAVTLRLPVKVNASISKPDRSTTVTSTNDAPTNVTVLLKLFAESLTVMFAPAPLAMKVAAPVRISAPVLVMSPAVAVASKVPDTVDVPKIKPETSTIVTLAPVVETAPVKLFVAKSRSTSKPAADAVVVPPMINAPLFVIAPPAVTERSPVKVEAPISNALRSKTVTFCRPAPPNKTAPVKSFPPLATVMLAPTADAVKVATPVITSAPVLVMFPVVAVAPSVPDAVTAPRINPLASVILTFVAVVTETAPPN